MASTSIPTVQVPGAKPGKTVQNKIGDFTRKLTPLEASLGLPLVLLLDLKSGAYYVTCHLTGETITTKCDIDAVLDPDESDDYKLNRDIYTDTYAYKMMQQDATKQRSFEDIVAEYDTKYRPGSPLKIYGGQHRVTAIKEAFKEGVNAYHGLRVYFDLTTDQRLEIATVSNTSIAIANDLLDRMQEEWLGSELRQWCQTVGLLKQDQNFADKRNSAGTLTVRVARTLVVNYFRGKSDAPDGPHHPKVCSSGAGVDSDYDTLRTTIDWKDADFIQMGHEFSKLHELQRERVTNRETDTHQEFANKAIHPCVVAAWSYASGMLSGDKDSLEAHYSLPESVGTKGDGDPLNAKALSSARLKGVDPDTYRGLGARIQGNELGRMLELFLLQATKARKRGISAQLANAAIQSYEAKKAQQEAAKAIGRI